MKVLGFECFSVVSIGRCVHNNNVFIIWHSKCTVKKYRTPRVSLYFLPKIYIFINNINNETSILSLGTKFSQKYLVILYFGLFASTIICMDALPMMFVILPFAYVFTSTSIYKHPQSVKFFILSKYPFTDIFCPMGIVNIAIKKSLSYFSRTFDFSI